MRLLVSSLILLIATIALIVGLANKPLEPQVDAQDPGAWFNYAGGEWCDVKPDRPEKPRGKYEYRVGAKTSGGVA